MKDSSIEDEAPLDVSDDSGLFSNELKGVYIDLGSKMVIQMPKSRRKMM
jgi:hypothetical protein